MNRVIATLIARFFTIFGKRRKNEDSTFEVKTDARQDKHDSRDDRYAKAEYPEDELPAYIDYSVYVPPIKNQGSIGSCVSHSIVTGIETLDKWKNGAWSAAPLSEMFHYYKVRKLDGSFPQDNGQYTRDGMKIAKTVGVCPEKVYPYQVSAFNDGPTMPKFAESIARFWQITEYNRCYSNVGIKSALIDRQLVVIGVPVRNNIFSYRTGVLSYNKKYSSAGGHAMLIVGYDDTKKAFKVVNSWGVSWGQAGHGWISYQYLYDAEWFDAYAFDLKR